VTFLSKFDSIMRSSLVGSQEEGRLRIDRNGPACSVGGLAIESPGP
jgi:hypothetical protein